MRSLTLKRIVLLGCLIASIAVLSVYQVAARVTDSQSIERFINDRKHKQDYSALFNRSTYKAFTVSFDQAAFDALVLDMETYFDLYGTYRDNSMHPVDVTYEDGLGNQFTLQEVGFRTKSNTSRNLPLTTDWRGRKIYHQTSFQLQFDATHDYQPGTNEYEILRQREAFNLKQLNFEYAAAFDGSYDTALITEAFSHYLLRQAGLPAQNASYGLVYFEIADQRVGFGLYTFVEPIDRPFLNRHFDTDAIFEHGDLYKATDVDDIKAHLTMPIGTRIGLNQNEFNIRFQFSLANNSNNGLRTDFSLLERLIEQTNDPQTDGSDFERLYDVDLLLRMLAVGFLIGNTDDFRFNGNNYFIYFEVYTNRAVLLPFDYDNSLGYGRNQDPTDQYTTGYSLFPSSDQQNPLVDRILAIPEFRNRYVDYLETFATSFFDFTVFAAEWNQAKLNYEAILIEDTHLGNQLFGLRNAEWYFATKKANVQAQIDAYRNPS
jgi:spore coat protein H